MKFRKIAWKQKNSITLVTLMVMGLFANFALAEDGFVPLFDGKTLNGWISARSARDGDGGAFSVNKEEQAIHVHGDIRKVWPRSIEMQIGETPGAVTAGAKEYWKGRKPRRFHTGDLFLIQDGLVQAQFKRKGIWWDPNGGLYTGRELWTQLGAEKPKGEWNQMEIRVLGDKKATFILNGEVVLEIMNMKKKEGEKLVPLASGHIGLQAEFAELLYRNIQIKELDVVDGEGARKGASEHGGTTAAGRG